MRVEDHAERDGEHRGVGEGVSERERGQQILRMLEQPGDGFARARIFFREERHLPFAERKQRRFRQREKETRAREDKNRRYRRFHARILKSPKSNVQCPKSLSRCFDFGLWALDFGLGQTAREKGESGDTDFTNFHGFNPC